MKKVRKWMLASRFNFFVFGIATSALLCYIISFTPFNLKGSYVPFIIAEIISINLLYDHLKNKKRKASSGE